MDEDQFKTRLKIAKNKTDKDKKSEEGNKGSSMGSAFKMSTELYLQWLLGQLLGLF
tara:strand:- start:288 stop:455 length:168 start_codon:yes stop_codon:yes gene_type:complete